MYHVTKDRTLAFKFTHIEYLNHVHSQRRIKKFCLWTENRNLFGYAAEGSSRDKHQYSIDLLIFGDKICFSDILKTKAILPLIESNHYKPKIHVSFLRLTK